MGARLTHIGLVLESEVAPIPHTMEVGGSLAREGTVCLLAILRGSEALKAFLHDGRVFAVIVGVHLYIRCADVHLVAPILVVGIEILLELGNF